MNAIKRVQEAIKEIQKGNMVIMLDDEDRENEGDLVYSAALSTPDMVNFMVTHAKGLVCVSLPKETADRLELNPMVTSNTSSYETAFTVSVDAASAATGISAIERDDTIKILANPISRTNELVRPGHIFPLIAKDGGVLVRTGHTEGSVDLCKLAGLNGEAVICEILKEDGTMARRDDLDIFALKHNLKQVYISDLVEYRLSHEKLVEEISSANKKFFSKDVIQKEFKDHLGNIHTAIIFGEIKEISHIKFHTIRPDIKMFLNDDKLHSMLKTINFMQAKGGILIFLNNGRKNSELEKNYGIGAQILNSLNIKQIKLMTSGGKHSFVGLQGFGLEIVEEIQIES
ncbi:bifunctional 3,4-dihydroxy-2-butanone 4-phosphate synthase/GTP cyclohydrolase II [Aliarcobacter butzleri]|uniref:bifunctional 3,4-dihydroxy-2-butanone 4-phosphate synthase/GTP cyclohydrolase II n=1 Tax=Aliarcobacter butzleri TaxID=28197 RepID=UPI000659D6B4|nr:bifunctional 3,4-dihydroxy-2-butanone 4-phosphate synthase/GTP cyclohydrolase II [Aliarcobacter butzleri]KLE04980.1 3,4-dihydroxy-2-butanone 4-phosphate synthase [Aliarcobacter butzleri L353]MCG3674418.1 bifunctional 3,4-dihydroxy-2-butanone 4-phosphate synthase/GTP cyclohydrolase II [Aliarcobacter butzleri]MCG3696954.1 bifunctional 3,4-dihydroxy-2-butanone 4-phosphate synthase/GTP cyclohydrolase II [Aliarcobacter butzleri]MCG3698922.1 bifunctional 3,4-dihydroxy-2-butanone 4-phosphate syntha